jgi:SAM-dependent methyltransferase
MAGRVSFVHGDATDLPFEPASFTAAFALESIMHMPSRAGVLAQIATVVRPGAPIVVTDLFRTGSPDGTELATGFADANLLTLLPALDDYRNVAGTAGLDVLELLDITDNTRRGTFDNLVRSGKQQHDQLVALVGTQAAGLFDTMCASLAHAENLGYLLLTARR